MTPERFLEHLHRTELNTGRMPSRVFMPWHARDALVVRLERDRRLVGRTAPDLHGDVLVFGVLVLEDPALRGDPLLPLTSCAG